MIDKRALIATMPARADPCAPNRMIANPFCQGVTIGFAIAAPVGPIGILCIRRSLSDGMPAGFAAGLGAATADAAYGAVAAFGLSALSGFLIGQQFWLGLFGGIFLCYLGFKTFSSSPASEQAQIEARSLSATYLSTFLLTLTNPATIFSFVGLFAGFGFGRAPDYYSATAVVLGVFTGSALWWLILSSGVGMIRERLTPQWMRGINRLSGAILIIFGVLALAHLTFSAVRE
jgi:threonine/homoserine/homoserine lactone efflux protein